MRTLIYLFGIFFAWQAIPGHAQGQPNLVSSEKDGVFVEAWLESLAPAWESVSLCCSITNKGAKPYLVDLSAGSGVPPLYVTLADRSGKPVAPIARSSQDTEFMTPGQAPLGDIGCRLFPGESMLVQFGIGAHFPLTDLGGAEVNVTWNNRFDDQVGPSTFVLTLPVPDQPAVMPRSVPRRLEFTSRELMNREDRLHDGLRPLPPRSFLQGQAKGTQSGEHKQSGPAAEDLPESNMAEGSEPWTQAMTIYEERSRKRLQATTAALVVVACVLLGGLIWWRRQKMPKMIPGV